jgi:glycosyltransferase involved in cell wall biosynthesis
LLKPARWARSAIGSVPRRFAALRCLPGKMLDQARINANNRRRRRCPPVDLAIFDDSFPHLLSAFRIAEFNSYFAEFSSAEVHTTCATRKLEALSYEEVLREYAASFPQFAGRVVQYDPRRIVRAGMAYVVFINNVARVLDTIDRHHLPFVFTLYPGGGFQLDVPSADAALQRVMQSPWFRKVIVTQRITQEYLLQRGFCRPDQIEFIFGGVSPCDEMRRRLPPRPHYRKDKPTFDVCFVANKYIPRGVDKGYDVFIEVAKSLARLAPDIRYHVVGPYNGSDIDVSDIADRICFYGLRRTDFFPAFYSRMDAILSPNVPFVLGPGCFDGFPTGCCIEAGASGVAVLCSDELRLNVAFKDGEEIVIVPRDVDTICDRVLRYYRDEEALQELSRKTQIAFHRVFNLASQMTPRIRLLREVMEAA